MKLRSQHGSQAIGTRVGFTRERKYCGEAAGLSGSAAWTEGQWLHLQNDAQDSSDKPHGI